MKAKKQHKSTLNRLLRDERISPNRRAYLETVALVLDSEVASEEGYWKLILLSQFGDPRHVKLRDPEDPPSDETHLSRRDAAAMEQARSIVFESILGRKQTTDERDATDSE